MNIQEKEDIIKTLLSSLRYSPPGGKWQFFWNPNNPYSFSGGFGFEFYIDFKQQTVASIRAIKCYPNYLNGYSISTVSSLLHKYFESVIADIGADELFFPQDCNKSVLDFAHPSQFASLVNRLDRFIVENAKPSVYLMPVNGFPCPLALVTKSIAWVQGDFDLSEILGPFGIQPSFIKNAHFPPISDTRVRYHWLTGNDSWFICHASSEAEAESIFKRMAGALSVILKYPKSRLITGRKMIKGRAKFSHNGSFTIFDKPSLVPAVGEPIEITKEMINKFNRLVVIKSNDFRIQVALEYLSDAWGNTSRLSFINNSIAMDALFGIDRQVRRSILTGVENHAVAVTDAKEKYDLILKIRNGLLHGEYPNIELCPYYLEFFEKFKSNPIDEQVIIINACILKLSE